MLLRLPGMPVAAARCGRACACALHVHVRCMCAACASHRACHDREPSAAADTAPPACRRRPATPTRGHPQGVFVPAQVAAAASLLARDSNLQSVLAQFFREDLLAWTSKKGRGGSGPAALPSDTLKSLIVKNARQVRRGCGRGALPACTSLCARMHARMLPSSQRALVPHAPGPCAVVSDPLLQVAERLKQFAPARVGEDEVPRTPIHKGALELADAAMSAKMLCRMDPTWHPWF